MPIESKPALRVFPPYLQKGAHGRAVRLLKLTLKPICTRAGVWPELNPNDGKFDCHFELVVRWVQADVGALPVDGCFGPKTRAAFKAKYGVDFDSLTLDGVVGEPTFWTMDGKDMGEWSGTCADDPRYAVVA
jgi:hypothetical protein